MMIYLAKVLNLIKLFTLLLLFMTVLISCGFKSKYEKLMEEDESYLNTDQLAELRAPKGITLPIQDSDYQIPVTKENEKIEKKPDVLPPNRILSIIPHSRIQFIKNNTAMILIKNSQKNPSIWMQVVNILRSKKIIFRNYDNVKQVLNTDWIEWSNLNDKQKYFGNYQIFVKSCKSQKIQILTVKLLVLKKNNKIIFDPMYIRRYTAEMINLISIDL